MSTVTKAELVRHGARPLTPIRSREDIPEPMDEAAATEFYSTHEFTAEALDQMPDAAAEFKGGFVRTRPISIRLPEPMLAELKQVAAGKGVAYQALIKIWLDERLQQERALKERRTAGGAVT